MGYDKWNSHEQLAPSQVTPQECFNHQKPTWTIYCEGSPNRAVWLRLVEPLKWCGDETGWMGHIEVSFPNIFHGGKNFMTWGLNASCLIVVWYFQQYQVTVTRFISFGWPFLFSQITGVGEQELLNQLLSWVTKFVSLRRRRDTHSRRCWIPSVLKARSSSDKWYTFGQRSLGRTSLTTLQEL